MPAILALFLLISTFAGKAIALPEQDSNPRKSLLVGCELDFEPYAFFSDDGKPKGFSIELLQAVSKRANIKLDVKLGSWYQIRQELLDGHVDVLPMMAKSTDRAKLFDFSDTTSVALDGIFIRANDRTIHREKDLYGKMIIVERGDYSEDYIRATHFPAEFISADTINDAFKLLIAGQGDAIIMSQVVGLVSINNHHWPNVQLAQEPRFGDYKREYGFAVKKGRHDLIDALNEGLKSVQASGEYREIYNRWFSNLDPESHQQQRRQRQLVLGLLIAVGLSVILTGFLLFFRTSVRRQKRSLAVGQQRFRGLVENMPGVVFQALYTDRWRIIYSSDMIETITGYPAADFVNGIRTFRSIVYPEDQGSFAEGINAQSPGRAQNEFRIVTRSGEIRWLHSRATVGRNVDGLMSIDGIFIDVTETHEVTQLLLQQQTKMAASARLSAIGEMASGIAHEINNPLAIITLRTHQLALLAAKGDVKPSDVLNIISGIESTSIRISKIVKSLQIVARESEQDPFEMVSLKTIIGDTFELCFQRMKKHGINIYVEEISDLIEISCRRVQISQVLINLLNNSFDAVTGLPVRYIRISARPIHEAENDKVEMSIVDSGPKIPAELSERIFQPFFTTKGVGKGTGLGLSLSKGIIEAHDGTIRLDTASRETRFVITLPVHQPGRKSDTPGQTT